MLVSETAMLATFVAEMIIVQQGWFQRWQWIMPNGGQARLDGGGRGGFPGALSEDALCLPG